MFSLYWEGSAYVSASSVAISDQYVTSENGHVYEYHAFVYPDQRCSNRAFVEIYDFKTIT
jgi:hypothetical protein